MTDTITFQNEDLLDNTCGALTASYRFCSRRLLFGSLPGGNLPQKRIFQEWINSYYEHQNIICKQVFVASADTFDHDSGDGKSTETLHLNIICCNLLNRADLSESLHENSAASTTATIKCSVWRFVNGRPLFSFSPICDILSCVSDVQHPNFKIKSLPGHVSYIDNNQSTFYEIDILKSNRLFPSIANFHLTGEILLVCCLQSENISYTDMSKTGVSDLPKEAKLCITESKQFIMMQSLSK